MITETRSAEFLVASEFLLGGGDQQTDVGLPPLYVSEDIWWDSGAWET